MTSGRPYENAETAAAPYHDLSRLRGAAYRQQHTTNSSMSSNDIPQQRAAAMPNHLENNGGGHQQEPVVHQTPLHGRYVTDNVVENKTLSKLLANQKRRMEELERVHKDLEMELETETKKRQQLEVAFEVQEREWYRKQESLQESLRQRDVTIEEANALNKKLSKQVEAKTNEMFQMMRRMVRDADYKMNVFFFLNVFFHLTTSCRLLC